MAGTRTQNTTNLKCQILPFFLFKGEKILCPAALQFLFFSPNMLTGYEVAGLKENFSL